MSATARVVSTENRISRIRTRFGRSAFPATKTSFSLLVPRVNLPAFSSVTIRTDGVTTHHAFSIIPALNHGQRDFYQVTPLHGTASNVVF